MPANGKKNINLAINLSLVVIGMLAMAYASVPFYRLFCQVTGYGGTTQEGTHTAQRIVDRTIAVTFNTDIDPALPWEFKPGEPRVMVKVGQQVLTHFVAHNLTQSPVTGRATYNVTPFSAGSYFVKIECFCFKEQTLAPGQRVDMPVLFYIDPAIMDDPDMKDIKTITLSYTFFPVKTESKSTAKN